MLSIYDVRKSILEKGSIIVSLYTKKGYFICKTSITPFKEEMKKANNVLLFLDEKYNIIAGQIGLYTYEKGIHCIGFSM